MACSSAIPAFIMVYIAKSLDNGSRWASCGRNRRSRRSLRGEVHQVAASEHRLIINRLARLGGEFEGERTQEVVGTSIASMHHAKGVIMEKDAVPAKNPPGARDVDVDRREHEGTTEEKVIPVPAPADPEFFDDEPRQG